MQLFPVSPLSAPEHVPPACACRSLRQKRFRARLLMFKVAASGTRATNAVPAVTASSLLYAHFQPDRKPIMMPPEPFSSILSALSANDTPPSLPACSHSFFAPVNNCVRFGIVLAVVVLLLPCPYSGAPAALPERKSSGLSRTVPSRAEGHPAAGLRLYGKDLTLPCPYPG